MCVWASITAGGEISLFFLPLPITPQHAFSHAANELHFNITERLRWQRHTFKEMHSSAKVKEHRLWNPRGSFNHSKSSSQSWMHWLKRSAHLSMITVNLNRNLFRLTGIMVIKSSFYYIRSEIWAGCVSSFSQQRRHNVNMRVVWDKQWRRAVIRPEWGRV